MDSSWWETKAGKDMCTTHTDVTVNHDAEIVTENRSVEAEVTWCGKLFQGLLPAIGKHGRPWSPAALVEQTVRQTLINAGADGWCRRRICHRIGSTAPYHEDIRR